MATTWSSIYSKPPPKPPPKSTQLLVEWVGVSEVTYATQTLEPFNKVVLLAFAINDPAPVTLYPLIHLTSASLRVTENSFYTPLVPTISESTFQSFDVLGTASLTNGFTTWTTIGHTQTQPPLHIVGGTSTSARTFQFSIRNGRGQLVPVSGGAIISAKLLLLLDEE